jgi:putative intracellular protease/amidase
MKITKAQYRACLSELPHYSDRLAYVSDLALSAIWGDPDGCESDIPAERLDVLRSIYDAANRTVSQICAAAGLSARELADRFAIPVSTVFSWRSGHRDCPAYTRMMMQECLGLLTIDFKS